MEVGFKETAVSLKNFPALRAALGGSELPIHGSMQAEAGEFLPEDTVRLTLSPQDGERTI